MNSASNNAIALSDFRLQTCDFPAPLPPPRVPVSIRTATLDDFDFIDSLQSKTTMQVGWMPKQQIEGKIRAGNVLVACGEGARGREGEGEQKANLQPLSPPLPLPHSPPLLGYCIGHDQYFKRDDVGIIYALNVVGEYRRSFIGAALLKAMFDRAAYGCRLFCCWCAQELAANRFWEAMGFVPLAFRAGANRSRRRAKPRVHIFWQKRIRAGDDATPYWFPSQTQGGSIREDRLVFPIPPGTHWSDAKPIVLPGVERDAEAMKRIATPRKGKKPGPARLPGTIASGGLRSLVPAADRAVIPAPNPKPAPRPKMKNDPRLVAAARELRDRWLEKVNSSPILSNGKYNVTRAIEHPRVVELPLLLAA
jgi:hypothetical protein